MLVKISRLVRETLSMGSRVGEELSWGREKNMIKEYDQNKSYETSKKIHIEKSCQTAR